MTQPVSFQKQMFMQMFTPFARGDTSEKATKLALYSLEFIDLDFLLSFMKAQSLIEILQKLKISAKQKEFNAPTQLQRIQTLLPQLQRRNWQSKIQALKQHIIDGIKMMEIKKYKQAMREFQQSLKLKATQQAHLLVALMIIQLKMDLKVCYEHIEKALEFDALDNYQLKYYEQLVYSLDKSKTDLILKCLNRAITLKSKIPEFHLQLILKKYELNQNIQNTQKLMLIIQQNCKQSIEKHFALGVGYLRMNKIEQSLEEFKVCERRYKQNQYKKLSINSHSPEFYQLSKFHQQDIFYYYLGKTYNLNFQIEESFQAFQKGLKLNQKCIPIWKQILSYLQRHQNREAEIIQLITQKIISFQEIDFEVHSMIINLAWQLGDKQSLVEYCQFILQLQPINSQRYCLVAKAYFTLRNFEKCKYYCKKAIFMDSNNHHALNILGTVAIEQKKIQEAKLFFQSVIDKSQCKQAAHFNLGLLQYNQQNYQAAAENFEKALTLKPDLSMFNYMLSRCYSKLGDIQSAMQKVSRLYDNIEDQFLATLCLANVQFQNGKYLEARTNFERIIKQKQNHKESVYKLALIKIILLQDEAQLGQIRQLTAKLIQMNPYKIQHISIHGLILSKLGQKEQAFCILNNGLRNNRQSFQIYYHLGRFLYSNQTYVQQQGQYCDKLLQVNNEDADNNYYSSLFYLGLQQYDIFIEKLEQVLIYYKQRIKKYPYVGKKQINLVYRRILSDLEYLRYYYPQSLDLMIILAILYRDIGKKEKSNKYFKLFLNNDSIDSSILINFYNKNSKYHSHTNYVVFIFQNLLQTLNESNEVQGMKLYTFLSQANYQFLIDEKNIFKNKKKYAQSFNTTDTQQKEKTQLFSSQILFNNFDKEQLIKPISSIQQARFNPQSSKYSVIIDTNESNSYNQGTRFNSLQRKITKKKLKEGAKSLIIISNKNQSQIQGSSIASAIFVDDNEEQFD